MTYKRTKTKHITFIVLGIIAYLFYVMMSDIYPILPPLMGMLFLIFHKHYNDEKFYTSTIVLACLFFYEFDKTLLVGVIPCVFFIVRFFVAEQLESIVLINAPFVLVYVCSLYLLYFAGLLLCNVLFKTPMLSFSTIYMYYLIMDCISALIYYYLAIKE